MTFVCLECTCDISFYAYVGVASAASSLSEEEVDQRVKLYIDMEDPDIIMDSSQGTKYDVFLSECEQFFAR